MGKRFFGGLRLSTGFTTIHYFIKSQSSIEPVILITFLFFVLNESILSDNVCHTVTVQFLSVPDIGIIS